MKTRAYFIEKTSELKSELKETINELFKCEFWLSKDESNCIDFENSNTSIEESGMISVIEKHDHDIVIYPSCPNLDPIDLNSIGNIHDLMLIHYIALNNAE